jgi:hypothetical protein
MQAGAPPCKISTQEGDLVQAVLTADLDKLDLNLVTLSFNLNLTVGIEAPGASLKNLGRKVKDCQALTLLIFQLGNNIHHATPMDRIKNLRVQIIAWIIGAKQGSRTCPGRKITMAMAK